MIFLDVGLVLLQLVIAAVVIVKARRRTRHAELLSTVLNHPAAFGRPPVFGDSEASR